MEDIRIVVRLDDSSESMRWVATAIWQFDFALWANVTKTGSNTHRSAAHNARLYAQKPVEPQLQV